VGPTGTVVLTDVNPNMLELGRDRLANHGIVVPVVQCDGERLPFASGTFDCVTVAFGLRNMTHKDLALGEFRRVLRAGGRLLVLEFSRVWRPLERLYDLYSFQVLPRLGQAVAGDAESYRYLAESIRMHPDQETLRLMIERAGFDRVEYANLAAGVVALHRAVKY
jgi:demethylmenaquinone methyltransferase/2-methoxy-6-polyprenyl-1,4-benzoquinol methylase